MRNDANTKSQPSAVNFSIWPSVALIVLEPQVNTFRLVLTPFRCGSLSPSTASVWVAKMEDTQMEKAILMVKMIMNYGIPWESMGFLCFFFCFFRVSYRHSELQGTWSPPLCHRSTTSPPKRAWPRRWLWRPGRRDCWDETIVGSKTGWWFEHVWNRLKYTIIILYKYYNTIYCIFFWIIKVPSYLGMMIHRLRVIETPVSKLRGPWR